MSEKQTASHEAEVVLIEQGRRLFQRMEDRRPMEIIPTGVLKNKKERLSFDGSREAGAMNAAIREEIERREAKNKILEFVSNLLRKSSSVVMPWKVGTESDDRSKKAVKEYFKKRKEENENTPFSEKIKGLDSDNLSELEGKVKNAEFALGVYDKEFSVMEKDIAAEKERRERDD